MMPSAEGLISPTGVHCYGRPVQPRARPSAPIGIEDTAWPAPRRPCLRPRCTGVTLCAVTKPMDLWFLGLLLRWPEPPGCPGGLGTGPL